jgi:hypothetical protein
MTARIRVSVYRRRHHPALPETARAAPRPWRGGAEQRSSSCHIGGVRGGEAVHKKPGGGHRPLGRAVDQGAGDAVPELVRVGRQLKHSGCDLEQAVVYAQAKTIEVRPKRRLQEEQPV